MTRDVLEERTGGGGLAGPPLLLWFPYPRSKGTGKHF